MLSRSFPKGAFARRPFAKGRRRGRGFTLIELMFVLLFAAALMVIGIPSLQQMIHRSRLEGAARECAMVCQRARLEAIKQGLPVVVRFDTKDRTIISWIDANGDGVQDPEEGEFIGMGLAGTVEFKAPGSTPVIEGFTTDPDGGYVTFFTDGSIDEAGAVHFGDARSNLLQLELRPRATGNVKIRKWDAVGSKWIEPREGQPWEWY